MGIGKKIRLMAAAKEFNVGANTIIEFLNEAGFVVRNSLLCKVSRPPKMRVVYFR